jgi:choline-sulfatase
VNVLLLMSDEHNPKFLGNAGHALARTPNLDRLAARGTRFTNAWCNSPICVPSRASFATGRYVHDTGCWDNAIAYDGRIAGWAHRLQAAGVRVESIGKLHYRNACDPTGFDRQLAPLHIHAGIGQVWGSVRDPLPFDRPAPPMLGTIGAGESDYNRFDRRVAELACDWLRQAATGPSRPWCLFVGFLAPHFPLIVPPPYLEPFALDRIAPPKRVARLHPWVEAFDRYTRVEWGWSDTQRLRAVQAYLGLCLFVDAQVGRVLDALETLGLADDTLVIYMSDHGDNAGARGLWGKSTLYSEAAGVPLIVAGPGVAAGTVETAPATLVDLHPTILQAFGLDAEAQLPGRSLLEPPDPDRIAFSEYHAIGAASGAFMLRTGCWKFHHYVGFDPELFDLGNDPEELDDVAARRPDIVARCDALLRRICDPREVDRAARRDQAALVERFGGRNRALQMGAPGATPVPAD